MCCACTSVYGRVHGCVAGGGVDARAGTVFWVGVYVCVRMRVCALGCVTGGKIDVGAAAVFCVRMCVYVCVLCVVRVLRVWTCAWLRGRGQNRCKSRYCFLGGCVRVCACACACVCVRLAA